MSFAIKEVSTISILYTIRNPEKSFAIIVQHPIRKLNHARYPLFSILKSSHPWNYNYSFKFHASPDSILRVISSLYVVARYFHPVWK